MNNNKVAKRPVKWNQAKTQKAAKSILLSIFRAVFIIGICFMILYPLLTKISMSFMTGTDLYDRTVKVVPKHFTLTNYRDAILFTKFFQKLFSSTMLSFLVGLLQTLSCTAIGYGFARFNFKGRGLIFTLVIICMVVPTQILLTPLYLNFKSLGMVGNLSPFIALALTGVAPRCGLYIFLARQFFRGIPKEIDEAAGIDGAGPYRTFVSIMLKSAVPIMVTIFLFSFVWQWGENSYTTLFYPDLSTLAQQLGSIGYDISSDVYVPGTSEIPLADQIAYQSIIRATSTILVILPLLVLYVFSQKFFIQSVERTGMVG